MNYPKNEIVEDKSKVLEAIFWSIALPGFAQILNRKIIKGFMFIVLEIFINVKSNFNEVIYLSFHGRIEEAIVQTDYQWLMFYPCLYMFVMWDAFKDAGGGKEPYAFIPFAFSAFFITIGLIYSSTFEIGGVLLGSMWLPILFLPIGIVFGKLIRSIILKNI